MASRGIRLPPSLSDLLRRLSDNGRLFIELYDQKKKRMQDIANKLSALAREVNEMQKTTNTTRMMGAVLGALGIVATAAALLAGGLASEGAVRMAMVGGAAAMGGGAAVITANTVTAQLQTEKISLETVEELGRELLKIAELLKDVLEEIKALSEELEEKSSSLLTTTREQARRGLSETRQLQQLLRQTAEQAGNSREVTGETLTQVRELLNFIVSITRITSTPESDAKLRTCITDSALQCEKTVHEFAKMRNTLKDFEEMQIEQEFIGWTQRQF
ncbi:hypothetical protein ABVT39_021544 [Epinephelus coioides]